MTKLLAFSLICYVQCAAFSAEQHKSSQICLKWFQSLHISPTSKDCDLTCSSGSVDMGTFDCPNNCDIFCKQTKLAKCALNEKWRKSIKDSYPPSWASPNEKLSPFTAVELEMVLDALSKLSDSFPIESLGVYKLEKSKDPFARSTPSSYFEGKIILYQNAFSQPENLSNILVHEIGHHLHETILKSAFQEYKKVLKWEKDDIPRQGPYITSNGKNSPEEDFASNFEAYVTNPKLLESKVPKAYSWMKKKLKEKFSRKECTL